ncbi:kinesin [Strigomonas culicis]|uniref:Kinesin n=1 Tax=Strigomonas culicis TaxID=28005 RepID=S9VXU9_9TRYP|nr:kinesin [Strigomonas culicis]|eukprot:EPY28470.1 kinesin [Strigomonas culicis]
MATTGTQRVMVAVRVRPMLKEGSTLQCQEKFELQGVHRTSDTDLKVELTRPGEPAKSSMFTFDYIFDQESTQLEVYEDAVVDMVDAALVGVSATMLAYGQTGSGKTFTMLGDVKPNPLENDLLTNHSGMFLRVLSDLIEYRQRRAQKGWHVVVGLSCVEIYNDKIRDLFGGHPDSPPPSLNAKMIGDDVLLPGLLVKEMTTIQDVFNEIQLAIARRSTRYTESNATSSRSHCLFLIDILQQAATAPAPSLNLLDLTRTAGEDESKQAKRSAATPTSRKPRAGKGGAEEETARPAVDLPAYMMPFQGNMFNLPGQKEPVYASKIILADLAGSERIAKTGVTGEGLKEAAGINSSLTALGNVVHSLHEGSFVSYRISALTRMLKPTFSQPESRVLLLAQCSPTQMSYEETISTLYFANKVKAMRVVTATGAEAEKMQFDYVETERLYDSICSDLHIFQAEMGARPTVIHRRLLAHQGCYYDAAATTPQGCAKITMRDRRAALEAMGAIAAAQRERAEIVAQQDAEKAEEAHRRAQAIAEERDRLVREHWIDIDETKAAVRAEVRQYRHVVAQRLIADEQRGRERAGRRGGGRVGAADVRLPAGAQACLRARARKPLRAVRARLPRDQPPGARDPPARGAGDGRGEQAVRAGGLGPLHREALLLFLHGAARGAAGAAALERRQRCPQEVAGHARRGHQAV